MASPASSEANKTITLTAKANNGYKFKNWTSDDGVVFADAYSASTTFKMPPKNVTVKANFEKEEKPGPAAKDISKATVTGIKDKTYTGKAITQSPVVKLDGKTLKEGTDYKVSYSDNVNAGTAKMTITGMGDCEGSLTVTFKINKAEPTITVSDIAKTIDAKPFILDVKVEGGGKISYSSDNNKVVTVDGNGKVTVRGRGTAKITIGVEATENYNAAKKTITVKIVDKNDVSAATVTGIKNKTYNGKKITQSPVVKLGGKTLKEGTDYTVSYKNNKNAGTATVIITGAGKYTGSQKIAFTIKKAKNTLKVSGNTVKVKYADVKKKKQTISAKDAFDVSKKVGKLTYEKSKGNEKITVSKAGKITVPKKMKKGTYKIKVKVTAAGNKNYKPKTKTVTVTVKIQ